MAERNEAEGEGRVAGGGDGEGEPGVQRDAGSRPGRAFTVRCELPDRKLAQNGSHGHWAVKARVTKAYRTACGWAFTAAKPEGWRVVPVEIEMTYRHTVMSTGYRPKDSQNAIGATKALIDGMVDAGVIPDDTAKWLQWGKFTLVSREDKSGQRDGVYVTVRAQ